ncbi:MAG: hypothetical protein L0Z50_40190 [Verrucomicrobiales bacterium]|nr:hypothetical protein [Verrucomicrobiales bacterium]
MRSNRSGEGSAEFLAHCKSVAAANGKAGKPDRVGEANAGLQAGINKSQPLIAVSLPPACSLLSLLASGKGSLVVESEPV